MKGVKPGTEETTELRQYNEFVAAIEKLESETGNGPEMITLYVSPDKHLAEVTGHLKDEYTKTEHITDKGTRTRAQSAISSILSNLKNYEHLPSHGLAIFCGKNRADPNGADLPCTIIEPVEPLNIYLYRCAPTFDIEPLKQMLDGKNVYGLLVLDVREAYWGFLRGNHVEYIGSSTGDVPSKQRKGGQSAPRFQRLREIAINEFFSRVGEHASATFLSEIDFFKRFKGLLIGGRSPTRENFLAGEYLNHEVRQRVIGVIEVARTDREGLSELGEKGQDIIKGMDIEKQEVLLERFHRDLETGAGLAAYGEASVRKNLAAGAVGTLLISSGLRKKRFQITCQDCGHAEERTFQMEPGTSVKDILTHSCRICSSPIIENEKMDITEELMHLAYHIHAKTVFISDDFDMGSKFLPDYGGIGAILRYRTGY